MYQNAFKANQVSPHSTKSSSFFKPLIQPQLTINQPNDIYEKEADAMADKVMRMPEHKINGNLFFKPAISSIQRKCAHCEEEEKRVQRKEINNDVSIADVSTENYINSLNGKGKPLTEEERNFFEPLFGYDFSNVQLHTNTDANQSAKNVNALAYTQGNNIVFGNNQYQPNTENGKKLIAHELTHVVQQSRDVQAKKIQRVSFNRSDCTLTAHHDIGLFFGYNQQTGAGWTPERIERFRQAMERQIEGAFNANNYHIVPANRMQTVSGTWDRFWRWAGADYSCPCSGGFMPRVDVSVQDYNPARAFDGWRATVIANDTGVYHRSSAAESTEVFGNLDEADVQATSGTGQYPAVHEFGHFIGLHHPGRGISGVTDEYHYTGRDIYGREVAENDLMGVGMGLRPFYFNAWRDYLNRTYPGCNYNISLLAPTTPSQSPSTDAPASGSLDAGVQDGGHVDAALPGGV